MANTLDELVPKIIGRIQMRFREALPFLRNVWLDAGEQVSEQGNTITVPLPPKGEAAKDVVPAVTSPTPGDVTAQKVAVTLDKWKYSSFHITSKEAKEIDRRDEWIPAQVEAAVEVIANNIANDLLAEAKQVGNVAGTAGTTPFASNKDVIARCARLLRLTPKRGRALFLDPAAYENLKNLSDFTVDKFGARDVQVEGVVPRVGGFDVHEEGLIPQHTAGSITGSLTVNGAHSVGAKSISVTMSNTSGDSASLKAGDIVTFGSDDAAEKTAGRSYAIAADVTIAQGATGTITLTEGLEAALAGSEAVNLTATHVMNLATAREAFVVAMRQTPNDYIPSGARTKEIRQFTDPVSGVPLQLVIEEQWQRGAWYLTSLYGVKCVRPEAAVRLLG